MEEQYSVEFFQTFVNNLQELCMSHFNFDKYVEVTGYISIEIDDARKERYVVSEMLSNGSQAVSESYCIKAFRTGVSGKSMKRPRSVQITREPKRQQTAKENFHGKQTYNVPSQANSIYTECVAEMDEDFDTSVNVSGQGSFETALPKSNQVSEEDHWEVYPRLDKAGSNFDNHQGISHIEARSRTHQEQEVLVNLPKCWNSSDMVEVKPELSSSMDGDDVIDLDLYEDDLDDSQFVHSPMADRYPIDGQLSKATSSSAKCKQTTGNDRQSNPYVDKVTRFSVKKLKKYYFEKGGGEQDFFVIPPENLDAILSDFFCGMRKKDGSPYDPGTLRTMQCHIDKYLKNGGYSWSILKDDQFRGSRDVLKSLLGDRIRVKTQIKHNPVTEQDIEVLFNTEQLGLVTAESLLNTMWFINSCFFGIKSLAEHFNLKWGEVILKVDENGQEYLQHLVNGSIPRGPKLYAKPMNISRCFVHMFKQYSAARPSWCMDSTSSFYLNLNKNLSINAWYLPETLNWHKLSFLWKRILTVGGLPQDKKPVLSVVGTSWNGQK